MARIDDKYKGLTAAALLENFGLKVSGALCVTDYDAGKQQMRFQKCNSANLGVPPELMLAV